MSHVMHKEKAKKEIIDLIKKSQKTKMTDNQIEQQIDLIMYHMYKFIYTKIQYSGILDSDVEKKDNDSSSPKNNNLGGTFNSSFDFDTNL